MSARRGTCSKRFALRMAGGRATDGLAPLSCYAARRATQPRENDAPRPAALACRRRESGHRRGHDSATQHRRFVIDYAETLRGVDESVGRIVAALRERGLLDSTLLVYTSDNGFLFGEHGLIDKRAMYEPSIRVPLLVHCPELVGGAPCSPGHRPDFSWNDASREVAVA